MAIDRMKKVTMLCPVGAANRLNRALYDVGAVELVDAFEALPDGKGTLKRHETSTEQSDQQLGRIQAVLNLVEQFAPEQKGFFEALAPLPLLIDPQELDEAIRTVDVAALYVEAQALDETYKKAERRIGEFEAQLEHLRPLLDLPVHVAEVRSTERVRLVIGHVPRRRIGEFGRRLEREMPFAWEELKAGPAYRRQGGVQNDTARTDEARVVVAFPASREEAARRLLAEEGFEEIPLPDITGTVRDRIREIEGDLAACREQMETVRREAIALAPLRRKLQVLKAYWESNRRRQVARGQAAEGEWVHVLAGFVRERDLPHLEQHLKQHVPEATLLVEDPSPNEKVPVSITSAPLVKPVQMLIHLFGLPAYSSFDPSPFIVWNFYLFFGICFGDVGYGVMLTALGAYLSRKTRPYEGLNNFARILFFAGISTTLFGMLLGSWFGDLYDPKYLGEGNVLLALKDRFMVLDPLAEPVKMLVAALAIGMLNQFYGIGLKMYGSMRGGDWKSAIFDGLFWLLTLPGMVLIVSVMFVDVPGQLFTAGVAAFVTGALGLVLTQGREAKGIVAKLTTGVVSLYGIVGSYGCTAFIGDTLSYCRLLALALTTSIVALTVNMIAGLLSGTPYVGGLLFLGVLVVGHTFNFAISLLGAFVHAMRLIFVEFFGRFYDGGAKPFTPLGFDSPSFVLDKTGSARPQRAA